MRELIVFVLTNRNLQAGNSKFKVAKSITYSSESPSARNMILFLVWNFNHPSRFQYLRPLLCFIISPWYYLLKQRKSISSACSSAPLFYYLSEIVISVICFWLAETCNPCKSNSHVWIESLCVQLPFIFVEFPYCWKQNKTTRKHAVMFNFIKPRTKQTWSLNSSGSFVRR